jgi:GDP-mannose 6-dehydrogenase
MKEVYSGVNGEIKIVDIGTAELIKFVNNSFHALKVAFGNEIGRICKELNIDVFSLMDLFVNDKILNISPYYFRPGFAYGGSCLPKDLKALNTIAHDKYINVPILASIDNSNREHIDFAYELIISKGIRNIGFLGISFKPGTDDLRFSPTLELVERLLGKGYNVAVYDENINLSKITGKNRDFLFSKLPHIDRILINDEKEFVDKCELFVVSHKQIGVIEQIISKGKKVIELNKVIAEMNKVQGEGITW